MEILDTLGNASLVRVGRYFTGSATLAAGQTSGEVNVKLLPDFGERYLSLHHAAWLRQRGLMNSEPVVEFDSSWEGHPPPPGANGFATPYPERPLSVPSEGDSWSSSPALS